MAEDRFANVFTAQVVSSAANTLTFLEMPFGITLRDKIAVVIDELYWYITGATQLEMTTGQDSVNMSITLSDQVADIADLSDRRIVSHMSFSRRDFGTAASAQFIVMPLKQSFAPPILVLPTRMFVGLLTGGLASAATVTLRMHFRTVPITAESQLREVMETFQLSN